MYPVVEVPSGASELPEQLGTKPKFWFRMSDGSRWLFKEIRPGTGEHWSEKACAHLAEKLELPHVNYELAVWRGRQGVVSRSFVPTGGRLVLGNEILFRTIHGYPDPQIKQFRAREHRLGAVLSLLRTPTFLFPIGFAPPKAFELAIDVFIGYLMFDVLIANQDRHHENWGVVVTREPRVHLAPTYDHGSSLGRNERDAIRLERLSTRDRNRTVQRYVERALSAFYPAGTAARPMTTIGAFEEASKIRPAIAKYWLSKLVKLTQADYQRIFEPFPREILTGPAIDFAVAILEANQRRLLALRTAQ